MKRVWAGLAAILCFSLCPLRAFANAGPLTNPGYPNSEVFAVEENCPVAVTSEHLTFDLSKGEKGSGGGVSGQVKAEYKMKNTQDAPASVTMAFPYIGAVSATAPADIAILDGYTPLSYDVYLGDVVEPGPDFLAGAEEITFENIVSGMSGERYALSSIQTGTNARLYTLFVQSGDELYVTASFRPDPDKTRVVLEGFTAYSFTEEGTVSVSGRSGETLKLLVLGADVDISVSARSEPEGPELENFEYTLDRESVKPYDYITDAAFKNKSSFLNPGWEAESSDLFKTQVYNAVLEALDKVFEYNYACPLEDALSQLSQPRLMILCYRVEFEGQEQKTVSVGCKTMSSMDRSASENPLYTFEYIFSPAKYWQDFKNLEVDIYTSPDAPYVVNSSVPLSIKEDGQHYYTHFDSLPSQALVFSLYKEETSPTAKAAQTPGGEEGGTPVWPFWAAGAVLFLGAGAFLIRQKKQN